MIETYKFERFVRVFMFVCVCGIGCFFFWHINLSQYRVMNLPSVDIERWFVSHSGAGSAGLSFYVLDWNLSKWRVWNLWVREILEKVLVDVKIYSSYVRME